MTIVTGMAGRDTQRFRLARWLHQLLVGDPFTIKILPPVGM